MKFKELLTELEINTKEVLERFSGNETLLERFICKFSKEATYNSLIAAFEAKQFEDEIKTVHTLKGIAANLGFEKLHEYCSIMLESLRETENYSLDKLENINLEYKRITNLINSYCSVNDK